MFVPDKGSVCLLVKKLFESQVWQGGYHCSKQIQRAKFKSLTRLFVFHLVLMLLGKVWVSRFLWDIAKVIRQTGFFNLGTATSLEGKNWI